MTKTSRKHLVYSTDKGRFCPECSQPIDRCNCKRNQGTTGSSDGIVRLERQVKGRSGKPVIIITGLNLGPAELKILAKKLKTRCGVGGSIENNNILIQGNKRDMIRSELESIGYNVKISGG